MTFHAFSSDYYDVLGVDRGATPEQIKQAFWQKAKQLHPDRNRSVHATDEFVLLGEAYRVLRDPEKRRAFDSYRRAIAVVPLGRRPPVWRSGGIATGFAIAILVAALSLTAVWSGGSSASNVSDEVAIAGDTVAVDLQSGSPQSATVDAGAADAVPEAIVWMSSANEIPPLVRLFRGNEAAPSATAQRPFIRSSEASGDLSPGRSAGAVNDWSHHDLPSAAAPTIVRVAEAPKAGDAGGSHVTRSAVRPIAHVRQVWSGTRLRRRATLRRRSTHIHRRRWATYR